MLIGVIFYKVILVFIRGQTNKYEQWDWVSTLFCAFQADYPPKNLPFDGISDWQCFSHFAGGLGLSKCYSIRRYTPQSLAANLYRQRHSRVVAGATVSLASLMLHGFPLSVHDLCLPQGSPDRAAQRLFQQKPPPLRAQYSPSLHAPLQPDELLSR